MEEFQIKAFPNPATNVVVATLPEWAEEIRLVSMNGKAVSIQSISKQSLTQFDVSSLAPGTYLVVASGEGLKASTPDQALTTGRVTLKVRGSVAPLPPFVPYTS